MTGFYSISCPQEEFICFPQIYEFITGHFTEETVIICSESMHSVPALLKIKASILDIDSEKAKELIVKSGRYDHTVLLGDDIPRFMPKINELYFFSDSSTGNIEEQWRNFQCSDEFIYAEGGSIKCGGRDFKYYYLEHTSGGNSILYNELDRMIKQHRLTELALSGARENVKSFAEEDPQLARSQGFVPLEDVCYRVDSCRYVIGDVVKAEYIAVDIEMRNSHKLIGYYTMIFDSGNGIVTDDIFYSPF